DMTATVTIITQEADNAIIVPNSAIQYAQTAGGGRAAAAANADRAANAAAVFVMRKGSPVRVPIQTGISDGTNTVVLSGLQAGDQVVTGISSGASANRSTGTGNIFGFGAPGGGNNNNNNRGATQGGTQGQQGGQGQNAQRTGNAGNAGGAGS